MKSGILVIDKEKGVTSRDVVNKICKKFNTKKVGHTGTLDPLATGVLVVGINEGCKLIEFLMSEEKEYVAKVLVGVSSDTLDVEGNMIYGDNVFYKKEEIVSCLNSFVGEYEQEVPKYSAVHVDGKRLYEYARNGEDVELPKRKVVIKNIELLDIWNEDEYQEFSFKVLVSKGTYIRSLIRDIGLVLGSPCIMKELKRVRQGVFKIEEAKKVDEVLEEDVVSLRDAIIGYDSLVVKDDEVVKKVKNGCKLDIYSENMVCLLDKFDNLLAIYEPCSDGIKAKKVFNGDNN